MRHRRCPPTRSSAATTASLPGPGHHARVHRLVALGPERDAQRGGQHDREDDDPEHRLRLAHELPQAHQRQLHERVRRERAVSHRADGVP